MKKSLSILLLSVLLCAMIIPVQADGVPVIFTADSKAQPGYSLTVDRYAMLDSGQILSEQYNPLFEGNVIYVWYKDGNICQQGKDCVSLALDGSFVGCQVYVQILYYEDMNLTMQCSESVSQTLTVTSGVPAPKILTTQLPNAQVGTAYYVKVECSDADAVFSEFMGSQLSEFGLYVTQHGEIEGTPTKAGNCHVNLLVTGEGGEDSVGLDITVTEVAVPETTTPAATETTVPSTSAPVAVMPTTDPTIPETDATTEAPASTEEVISTYAPTEPPVLIAPPNVPQAPQETDWWIYVLVAVVSLALGAGIAVLLVKRKK